MTLLLELTLRGAAAALVVFFFDRLAARNTNCSSRRFLWCLIPLAFLVPLHLTGFSQALHLQQPSFIQAQGALNASLKIRTIESVRYIQSSPVKVIWIAGMLMYAVLAIFRTLRASQKWDREPVSSDPSLHQLLENCKKEAGITAPIALVVSNSISSPAILGWRHPRILVPAPLVCTATISELRPILLHELAHFRWLDVPFNWLLTLVRAVHWFNPLAHFGAARWAHFREEAADETAVRWMRDGSGAAYGHALVRSLRLANAATPPFGAFAIAESVKHLRRRIDLITCFKQKSPRLLTTALAAAAILFGICSISAAESVGLDTRDLVASSVITWLKEIDSGHYEQSWNDSSAFFRKAVTSAEWDRDLKEVNTSLGAFMGRKQVSMAFQSGSASSPTPKAESVVVQFDSSFENQKYSFETVYFMKEADGHWRATGYFVHPR